MGRSRMKSDETTLNAGFAAVLGFNLRQLTRYVAGEVRPKLELLSENGINESMNDQRIGIALPV